MLSRAHWNISLFLLFHHHISESYKNSIFVSKYFEMLWRSCVANSNKYQRRIRYDVVNIVLKQSEWKNRRFLVQETYNSRGMFAFNSLVQDTQPTNRKVYLKYVDKFQNKEMETRIRKKSLRGVTWKQILSMFKFIKINHKELIFS